MLDIFNNDLFSITTLTDSINDLPFSPGQASRAVQWQEQGVRSVNILMESKAGVLGIVNPSRRGAPGDAVPKPHRTGRPVAIPHYQINDGINADEVQGIRAWGSETELETVSAFVDSRMNEIVQEYMDPTIEYQRLGALSGIILNGDTTTYLNLFDVFGVTQPTPVNFVLSASPATGAVRTKAASVVRLIAAALGNRPFTGVRALCGPNFYDALIGNAEVRSTFLNQPQAALLREGYAFSTFPFGGIDWEEYRGAGAIAVPTDECRFFPTGVAGMYKTVYAPGDWNETVNTIGLPRYAKQRENENGKGWHLEVQSNALSYVTHPLALINGTKS